MEYNVLNLIRLKLSQFSILLVFFLCSQVMCAEGGTSFTLGQKSDREIDLDKAKNDKEACKSAQRDMKEYTDELAKNCAEFGMGRSCLSKALTCDLKQEEKANGGGDNQQGVLSQLLGGASSQMFGAGAMGNPILSNSEEFNCKPKDEKADYQKLQESLYKDAKQSQKDAQDEVTSIQKDASTLTDAKKEMADSYQKILTEMRKMNTEKPLNEQALRKKASEEASQLMEELDKNTKALTQAERLRTVAQSEITRLYPSVMGACIDGLRNKKVTDDKELYDLRSKFENDIAQIEDLRDKQNKKRQFDKDLYFKMANLNSFNRMSYDDCLKRAKNDYQKGFDNLTSQVQDATNDINSLNTRIDNLQKNLTQIPKDIEAGIKAIAESNDNDRQSNLAQLQTLQASLSEKVTNYNSLMQGAQARLQQSQMALMQSEMSFRATQSVGQASLGGVRSMTENYLNAKSEMCAVCLSAGVQKNCKRPSALEEEYINGEQ